MSKKISFFIIIISLAILILALVFAVGYSLGKKSMAKVQGEEKQFLQSELGKFYPPLPEKITHISGEVLKIENNIIDLKTKIRTRRLPENGQDVYNEMVKKVIITDQTKIYQIDQQGKISPTKGIPTISLKLSDIKIGNRIAAEAEIDVKNLDSFEAKAVELLF